MVPAADPLEDSNLDVTPAEGLKMREKMVWDRWQEEGEAVTGTLELGSGTSRWSASILRDGK